MIKIAAAGDLHIGADSRGTLRPALTEIGFVNTRPRGRTFGSTASFRPSLRAWVTRWPRQRARRATLLS